jgi:hypothetical protein
MTEHCAEEARPTAMQNLFSTAQSSHVYTIALLIPSLDGINNPLNRLIGQ